MGPFGSKFVCIGEPAAEYLRAPFNVLYGPDVSADALVLLSDCMAAFSDKRLEGVVDREGSTPRELGLAAFPLLDKAGALDTANTVTFTSADGYEVSLPLTYLVSHYCPIVFDVNGSPIAESVGGTNQLWLGSTSAKCFARNIVSIRVETRDVVPEAPDGDAARDASYANLPNVGVAFGGEVA